MTSFEFFATIPGILLRIPFAKILCSYHSVSCSQARNAANKWHAHSLDMVHSYTIAALPTQSIPPKSYVLEGSYSTYSIGQSIRKFPYKMNNFGRLELNYLLTYLNIYIFWVIYPITSSKEFLTKIRIRFIRKYESSSQKLSPANLFSSILQLCWTYNGAIL